MRRKIIKIDSGKCDGCGLCMPSCPEGALQMIEGKARLVSELFCDGLGACLGQCPRDAIMIEEREAEPYDEVAVVERLLKQGESVVKAHLEHLKEHGDNEHLREALTYLQDKEITLSPEAKALRVKPQGGSCPSTSVMSWGSQVEESEPNKSSPSALKQWPVQISLVPSNAPYFGGADLLVAADCVPFAYANFHQDILRGKAVIVSCPKLDDVDFYREKLTEIFRRSNIKSLTIVHMEVPCCFGLNQLVRSALAASGKNLPVKEIVIGVHGERKQ
ncbi:MAG: 4Fe-4S binding protein [Methanobacteriota archaeon]